MGRGKALEIISESEEDEENLRLCPVCEDEDCEENHGDGLEDHSHFHAFDRYEKTTAPKTTRKYESVVREKQEKREGVRRIKKLDPTNIIKELTGFVCACGRGNNHTNCLSVKDFDSVQQTRMFLCDYGNSKDQRQWLFDGLQAIHLETGEYRFLFKGRGVCERAYKIAFGISTSLLNGLKRVIKNRTGPTFLKYYRSSPVTDQIESYLRCFFDEVNTFFFYFCRKFEQSKHLLFLKGGKPDSKRRRIDARSFCVDKGVNLRSHGR
eukprot:Lithocolla_globosa_v1_NODE_1355_length_2637_cov_3.981804.p1 type:complete len:266 gc:universal NODE_1355_length_2637_cov_3.981804:2367-1570(-)